MGYLSAVHPAFAHHTNVSFSAPFPLLCYKFDNNANDACTLHDNGIMMGSGRYTQGQISDALDFDGHTFVDIPKNSDLNFERNHAFSISYWIKKESYDQSIQSVFNKLSWQVGAKGWRIVSVGQTNQFTITDNHTHDDILIAIGPLTPKIWHHVVFTYDGNGMTDGMKGYLDGVLISKGGGGHLQSSIQNDVNLRIGTNTVEKGNFTGKLDDVQIYDQELSEAEVRYLHYGIFQPIIVEGIMYAIIISGVVIASKYGLFHKLRAIVKIKQ